MSAGVLGKPFCQFLRSIKDQRPLRPTCNAHHFRMMRLTDDHRDAAFLIRLGHQLLDPQHMGTGGIDTGHTDRLQIFDDLLLLAMGADQHRVTAANFVHTGYLAGTQLLQLSDHVGVVDNASQHHAAALFLRRLAGQLHSPLHAVAKPGALSQDHLHWPSPSSFTRCMTSSTLA